MSAKIEKIEIRLPEGEIKASLVKSESDGKANFLYEFEAPVEVVNSFWKKALDKVKKLAKIPGFRKGKAPDSLVEREYRDTVSEQAWKELASTVVESISREIEQMEGENHIPFDELLLIKPEKPLEKDSPFKGRVRLERDFVPPWEEIFKKPIKAEQKEISEKELEEALKEMAMRSAYTESVDGPIQEGDVVRFDFRGYFNGEPVQGLRGKNYTVKIEKESKSLLAPHMIGLTKGKHRIRVKIPEDINAQELAGKEVDFDVYILEIKRIMPPPIDDELAKTWGFENIEEMKKEIKKQMEQDSTLLSIKNQILEKISKANFPVPKTELQRRVMERIAQEMQKNPEAKPDVAKIQQEEEENLRVSIAIKKALREVMKERGEEEVKREITERSQRAYFSEASLARLLGYKWLEYAAIRESRNLALEYLSEKFGEFKKAD